MDNSDLSDPSSTLLRLARTPAGRYTVWMAIPADTQRVVLYGGNPGGEIWETGFWLHGGLPSDAAAANIQAKLLWDTLFSEADPPVIPMLQTTFLNSGGSVRGTRVYVYPTGGTHAAFVGEYTAPAAVQGSSNYYLPDQCCLVATLQTGLAGRRNRGRMYLPASGLQTGTSGQTATANAAAAAANLAAAFSDLANSDAGTPCVVSTVGGTWHPITSVKVDTKIDIQRRRANKQVAAGTATSPVS